MNTSTFWSALWTLLYSRKMKCAEWQICSVHFTLLNIKYERNLLTKNYLVREQRGQSCFSLIICTSTCRYTSATFYFLRSSYNRYLEHKINIINESNSQQLVILEHPNNSSQKVSSVGHLLYWLWMFILGTIIKILSFYCTDGPLKTHQWRQCIYENFSYKNCTVAVKNKTFQ